MRSNLNQVTNSILNKMSQSGAVGLNTNTQKVVMDRQYFNQIYKYKGNNAKLLNIRRKRFMSATSGDAALPLATKEGAKT